MKLLEAGGNAFDAAVAAGFVLQVVEPHLNGPGGDVPILLSRYDDSEPTVICGQGGAPAEATIEAFEQLGLDLIPGTGLLAACVPGAFGAWMTMLRDWGTMSLREALQPAIDYALHGYPIVADAIETIHSVEAVFRSEWPSSAAIYLQGGTAPLPGSLFSNPVLGRLYSKVVEHAESLGDSRQAEIDAALAYWYEGPIAAAIDGFCRTTKALDVSGERHGGFLRAGDLRGWRPKIERPLSVNYRDHIVYKCGPWSQGPTLLQALRILEGYNLSALKPDGKEFVHLVAETLKLVMADRDAWYGDQDDVPISDLLDTAYADERRLLIGSLASLELRPGSVGGRNPALPPLRRSKAVNGTDRGSGEPTVGRIEGLEGRPAGLEMIPEQPGNGDTCHFDVVDRWGNMVAATPSGGWLQSSPIIPELGFPLGTRLQMFWLDRRHPNGLAPGKRPRTTLTPSMSFKQGRPYLAFGTPGGDQQEQWSLLLLLLHVDFGMPLQRAIEHAAFHIEHLIGSFWPREISPGSLVLEGRFPADTIRGLRDLGHLVKVSGPWSEGRLSACSRESSGPSAVIRAGANPRGMQGYAIAR
jgi:gamma-glutamyltranspeptidase/glutathione hydrolase